MAYVDVSKFYYWLKWFNFNKSRFKVNYPRMTKYFISSTDHNFNVNEPKFYCIHLSDFPFHLKFYFIFEWISSWYIFYCDFKWIFKDSLASLVTERLKLLNKFYNRMLGVFLNADCWSCSVGYTVISLNVPKNSDVWLRTPSSENEWETACWFSVTKIMNR